MGLRKRIATTAAATVAAAGMAMSVAAPASASTLPPDDEFINILLAGYDNPLEDPDSNPYDFDIVTQAAIDTEVAGTLASLKTLTLFAPNDRAFEVLAKEKGLLPPSHRYTATVDEKAVYKALLTLPNAVPTIKNILLYHAFTGAKVTGKDVLSGPFTQRLTMANDAKLRVTVLSRSTRFPVIVLGDRDGKLFNDQVVKSKIDVIQTENKVVHGISDVLLP